MEIVSLILSIISIPGIYILYVQESIPLWLTIGIGLVVICVLVFLFVKSRKRQAHRYAAIRLGLEWIRLLYDDGEPKKRLRVSYFEKKGKRLYNVARVPYGTENSKVKFTKGEGFVGLLWREYPISAEDISFITDLPSASSDQNQLLERYREENANLSEKKILMFKKDVRSYLILALVHPATKKWLGAVCLDSIDPFEFEASENEDDELKELLKLLSRDTKEVVALVASALYDA